MGKEHDTKPGTVDPPSPEEKAAWDAETYEMEHAWIYLAGTNIPESDDEEGDVVA